MNSCGIALGGHQRHFKSRNISLSPRHLLIYPVLAKNDRIKILGKSKGSPSYSESFYHFDHSIKFSSKTLDKIDDFERSPKVSTGLPKTGAHDPEPAFGKFQGIFGLGLPGNVVWNIGFL